MRVSKQGIPLFHEHNRVYHGAVVGLVQDILQTESVGPGGYVTSRHLPERDRMGIKPVYPSATITEQYSSPPTTPAPVVFPTEAGIHERVIISCLAWGSYSTYVLTGEMGSGKSCTLNFVRAALAEQENRQCGTCKICRPIAIHLNFNKGFGKATAARILKTFRRRLAGMLRRETRRVFFDNALVDSFCAVLPDGDWEGFDRFLESVLSDTHWAAKTEAQKVSDLFQFVDKAEDWAAQLELLMQLLRHVRNVYRPEAACLFIIYDNIDSILPEAQYDILVEILRLQEFAKVKAIVALRYGTFARLNSQAAYSFGVIPHDGALPVVVLETRLKHWQQHLADSAHAGTLSSAHLGGLKQRLDYLMHEAVSDTGVLDRLNWTSGGSVRNGLYASERFFVNSVIPWDADPSSRHDLTRALLVSNSSDGELSLTDHLVANLLADARNGEFTTLNIRILQLVFALEHDEAHRNVINLIPFLQAIGRWDTEAIRFALNYLLLIRRPLIWVDGKSRYSNSQQLLECDDKLHLTEAGESYLRRMLKDLVYFQEAAMATDWPLEQSLLAPDYREISQRFALLRVFLRHFMLQDHNEIQGFVNWVSRVKRGLSIKAELISARVLRSHAQALLGIVRVGNHLRERPVVEELRNWHSLIIECGNLNSDLGMSYPMLERVEREFESVIGPGDHTKKGRPGRPSPDAS